MGPLFNDTTSVKSLLEACVNVHGQIEKSQGEILCHLVAMEKKNGTVFPNSTCLEKAKNWANHTALQLGLLRPCPPPVLPPEQVAALLRAVASPVAGQVYGLRDFSSLGVC